MNCFNIIPLKYNAYTQTRNELTYRNTLANQKQKQTDLYYEDSTKNSENFSDDILVPEQL